MKKKKSKLIRNVKETPKARKERVSSGVKFRASVFESKKRKLENRAAEEEKTFDER